MTPLSAVDFPSLGSYVLRCVVNRGGNAEERACFDNIRSRKYKKMFLNVGSKSKKSSEK